MLRDHIYRPPAGLRALTGHHKVGELHYWSEVDKANPNYIDAAVAHISDQQLQYEPNLIPNHEDVPAALRGRHLELMPPASPEEITQQFQDFNYDLLGQSVAKIGGATGYTSGTISGALIDGITAFVPWLGNVIYVNVFEITPKELKSFTQPGDFGASVFISKTRLAFGLHFAAAEAADADGNSLGHSVSYACSIQTILHEFADYSWM